MRAIIFTTVVIFCGFVLVGCATEGYMQNPPHLSLRDRPTFNYPSAPPAWMGSSSPQYLNDMGRAQQSLARGSQEWAREEMMRAQAAREWHRTDRARGGYQQRGYRDQIDTLDELLDLIREGRRTFDSSYRYW
ncbi:MAG: hypothetical protein R6V40_00235 [Candidatus Moraniibacteriota bacterium]